MIGLSVRFVEIHRDRSRSPRIFIKLYFTAVTVKSSVSSCVFSMISRTNVSENIPSYFQEVPDASAAQKASRAYNSWLAWWKNTLNTDDYMKFLATQETDFLSHVFHLYDSDLEDDEEEEEETDRGSDRQSMISAGTSRATAGKAKGGRILFPILNYG